LTTNCYLPRFVMSNSRRARAQAVRRISDKVTKKELEEQRVCV